MGLAGLGQTIEPDLGSAYGPRLKQVGDAFEMASSALNRRPERRDIVALRLWCLRAGGDEGGAAARLEHCEGPLRDVAADRIEDGIATGHNLSEISGVVVDDVIGSQVA
jgi:hypothetical protein